MRAYGERKAGHSAGCGHQECGICHPEQKNKKKRARREGKREAVPPLMDEMRRREIEDDSPTDDYMQ